MKTTILPLWQRHEQYLIVLILILILITVRNTRIYKARLVDLSHFISQALFVNVMLFILRLSLYGIFLDSYMDQTKRLSLVRDFFLLFNAHMAITLQNMPFGFKERGIHRLRRNRIYTTDKYAFLNIFIASKLSILLPETKLPIYAIICML